MRNGGLLSSQASLEHCPCTPALAQLSHLEGTLFATLQVSTLLLKSMLSFVKVRCPCTRELANKAIYVLSPQLSSTQTLKGSLEHYGDRHSLRALGTRVTGDLSILKVISIVDLARILLERRGCVRATKVSRSSSSLIPVIFLPRSSL